MNKMKIFYDEPLSYFKIANFLKKYINKDTIIVCIGTDRCIGDSLGPLVGSILKHYNFPFPVYGTIDKPIHALNINEHLNEIKNNHPNQTILAIDACLGDRDTIGQIHVRDYPVHPGKGVGKSLPNVGDISLIGIIHSNEDLEIFNSNNIRLNLVLNIAKIISKALLYCYSNLDEKV